MVADRLGGQFPASPRAAGEDAKAVADAGPDTGTDDIADGNGADSPDVSGDPHAPRACEMITLDAAARHQTVDGVGANAYSFPADGDQGWNWDSVRDVYDDLNLQYMRLVSWREWWETENDNDDPNSINWDGFQTTYEIIDDHDVAHATYLNSLGIEVLSGVWNHASWLAPGDPPSIRSADYDELAESLVSYLIHMEAAGVPQPVLEVQNEPEYYYTRYETPEQLRDAAIAVLDLLDAHGFNDVLLHGPNNLNAESVPHWANVWFESERLRDRTAALSFHTYWSTEPKDYEAIVEIANTYDKPIWATEVGHCAEDDDDGCDGTNFMRPWTWGTAWDWSQAFWRALVWARAERVYHWSLLGFDAAVSPTGERYPTFYMLMHYANYIDPGMTRIEAISGSSDILALGFESAAQDRSAILINLTNESRCVTFAGTGGPLLGGMVSSEAAAGIPLTSAVDGAFELPAQGLLSVRFGPSNSL